MTQVAPYREVQDVPLPGLRLPTDLEEQLSEVETLGRICEVFWESAFVPDSYRRRGQMNLPKETVVANMTAAAMIGRSLGVGMFTAWQNIFINTQNRPGLLVKFKRAVLLANHYRFVTIANDENVATVQGFRPGEDVPEEVTFTVTHARAAGLLSKATWQAYRPDLLYARALDRVCDRIGGDVLLGLPSVESLDDAVDVDEPVEKITAAFDAGEKGVTGPPRESVVARLTAERAQAAPDAPGSSDPMPVSQDTPADTPQTAQEWMRPEDYAADVDEQSVPSRSVTRRRIIEEDADRAIAALRGAGMVTAPEPPVWTDEDVEIEEDEPDDAVPAYAGGRDITVPIVPSEDIPDVIGLASDALDQAEIAYREALENQGRPAVLEATVTEVESESIPRISETAWANINAVFKNRHGLVGTGQKEARLRVISAFLARPIERGGQLTVDEGDLILEYLNVETPEEIRRIAGWRS